MDAFARYQVPQFNRIIFAKGQKSILIVWVFDSMPTSVNIKFYAKLSRYLIVIVVIIVKVLVDI